MRASRLVLWSLLLICAALLVAACGDDEAASGSSGDDASTKATESAHDDGDGAHDEGDDGHGDDDGAAAQKADAHDADASFDIAIVKGAVQGGPQILKVAKGDTVAITISSDVEDEAHLHGIDVDTSIPAGGTGVIMFTAKDQGSYELEAHETGALLATVNVS